MELTKRLLAYLCEIMLVASCIIFLIFLPKLANGQGGNIVVNGADYTSTDLLQYPANLSSVAQNVSARVVLEYADFSLVNSTYEPNGLLSTLSPRLVLEYADFSLVNSTYEPNGLPSALSPRVVVEYADFALQFNLQSVQGLNLTVAPRIIIEYADYARALVLVPEFPSIALLSFFMIVTLGVVAIYRRKYSARSNKRALMRKY